MRWGFISVAAVGGALLSTSAYAIDIVTPNAQLNPGPPPPATLPLATTEGGSAGNLFPTNGTPAGQQVLFDISSSMFSTLPSGDVITGLSFRPDVNLSQPLVNNPGGPFAATALDNVTIILATTSIATTSSDLTFADYNSANAQTTNVETVINNATVTVSSSDTAAGTSGPSAFDIHFPFANSYAYNPANGNLAVYILIGSNTGIPSQIDATETSAGGASDEHQIFGGAGVAAGLTNGNVDIIDFTAVAPIVTGVPEPATWALMLVGVGALGASLRRGRKASARPALA